jgi:hypothetical protein
MKILSLILLVFLIPGAVFAHSFSEIPSHHWSIQALHVLESKYSPQLSIQNLPSKKTILTRFECAWAGLKKGNIGIIASSLGATFVNTIGVLGLAVLFGNFTLQQIAPIIALNGTLELIFSAIIVLPLVKILQRQFPS